MKSCRDVRPQGGVMSRIRTEVARLSWLAGNSKELNIVGTVLGNRGTCLHRTRTCFTCAQCARVLDAVLRYGTACCGVVQGSGISLIIFNHFLRHNGSEHDLDAVSISFLRSQVMRENHQ